MIFVAMRFRCKNLSSEKEIKIGTQECEVIFAAISAVNNCEFCLSFHAMSAQHGVSAAEVQSKSR